MRPLEALREVFGLESFRGPQAEVIDHLVNGGDALVLMPTGGGKSLCYQVPALCRDGLAVVVSPLIALIQDQVEALRQYGVRAAGLHSNMPFSEAVAVERAMREGDLDLVYVAPERAVSDPFLELLERCRLALFAIDEAHCVSQWGHDFRPDYRELARLHARFPDVPRIALTATADPPTRKDILEHLDLEAARVFLTGFDRPNIRYRVVPRDNPHRQLLRFIDESFRGESGIVYRFTRAGVDATAAWLEEQGLRAQAYHAGLDAGRRQQAQERFLKEEGRIVVATVAFGMGIDKPDVRFVAHLEPPRSLEAYYQETGRAGRDGLPAEAWMTHGLQDVARLRRLIESNGSGDDQRRIEHRKLDALLAYLETTRCRRQVLLAHFGETLAEPCGNCDVCLDPPGTFDGTEAARKLLSCIWRTGQRFGAGHVIDVLRGTDNERVRRLGHHRLSTFGIGRDLDARAWRAILRQLAAHGLVQVDIEGHGGLSLGPGCREVLRGERRLMLRADPAPKRGRKGEAPAIADPAEAALFEVLRACRAALASEQGIPPYMIFHDTTLRAMASDPPADRGAFARLPGVGSAKLDRYAAAFLAAIAGHAAREAS
jgi:ATP-dependent DNA helicase RecQ